jgi:hypothetical protein
MIDFKYLDNKRVYITPYNSLALKVYNDIISKNDKLTFKGYLDNFKTGEDITHNIEANSIVIIIQSQYINDIYTSLLDKNIPLTYMFVCFDKIVKEFKYFDNLEIYTSYIKYLANQEIVSAKNKLINTSPKDEWLSENKNQHLHKRCFILATGPSLNLVDLSKLKDEYTIGVNGIYKISKEINMKYFIYVSSWYWKHHIDGIKTVYCKRRFLPTDLKAELDSDVPTSWINVNKPIYYSQEGYPNSVPHDFSQEVERYFEAGGTVIFLALQLAYHLGFKEVIILGLDHNYKGNDFEEKKHLGYHYDTSNGDSAHFDKDYVPTGIQYHVDLEAMENGYKMAKEYFEKDGRKILNASPGTKLDVFEKVNYADLFYK